MMVTRPPLGVESMGFGRWWYFDTNCLSELLKRHQRGEQESARRFISGREILITGANIAELVQRPDLCELLESTLLSAHVYVLGDIWRFWDAEVLNFVGGGHSVERYMDVFPWPAGLGDLITRRREVREAADKTHDELERKYITGLQVDLGAEMDERPFVITMTGQIAEFARKVHGVELALDAISAGAFPSCYVYFYTYYYRYMNNRTAVPETNDALDLVNALPLPYCERYYGERKFVNVLKRVKNHQPPSTWSLVTWLHKNGHLSKADYETHRKRRAILSRRDYLLPSTEIYTYTDLVRHLNGTSPAS